MYDNIIKDISTALYNAFGKEYKYYPETIEQGFKEPGFFILPLSSEGSVGLASRFNYKASFDIHYYPSKSKKYLDCRKVESKLYECLKFFNTQEGLVRALNMRSTIVDGVLHFMFDIKASFISVETNMESMSEVTINAKKKNR